MHPRVNQFLDEVRAMTREFVEPADIVLECAPLMVPMIQDAQSFLDAAQRRPADDGYARHEIYACPEGGISLFAMVWRPGQWTPVHDHGTWGVVGVVEGALEERNFIRTDDRCREDSGIVLCRGGVSILHPGTVTTFVPNPDHIHRTGVPWNRTLTITLHLYGREMSAYNVYDLELGRRSSMRVSADTDGGV